MNLRKVVLTAALLVLPASMAAAQTTYAQRHSINARRGHQQARINQGARSGQLTPHETSHIEHQEHAIHHEERADRAADGGRLTAGDRHTIAHQQNAESRKVYDDKHNLRTDPGVAPR